MAWKQWKVPVAGKEKREWLQLGYEDCTLLTEFGAQSGHAPHGGQVVRGRTSVGMEEVNILDISYSKCFALENAKLDLPRTLGPRWVNTKGPAATKPRALISIDYSSFIPCFRNDGVTGSSPVSGTTFLKNVSKEPGAIKAKARE
ncbi:MAG: hypothetical protein KUG65_13270 [Sphingomonadaceae bacterium]|nr:hypothetical protein [Sphingomonadaceae bacterium]